MRLEGCVHFVPALGQAAESHRAAWVGERHAGDIGEGDALLGVAANDVAVILELDVVGVCLEQVGGDPFDLGFDLLHCHDHCGATDGRPSTAESARYTLQVLGEARGGEIFVPKMPVYRLVDLVSVLLPDATFEYTQPRFTEKLHETLLSQEEARYTFERAQDYVICMKEDLQQWYQQQPTHAVPASFEYHSNQHDFLSRDELRSLINPFI